MLVYTMFSPFPTKFSSTRLLSQDCVFKCQVRQNAISYGFHWTRHSAPVLVKSSGPESKEIDRSAKNLFLNLCLNQTNSLTVLSQQMVIKSYFFPGLCLYWTGSLLCFAMDAPGPTSFIVIKQELRM